MAAIEVMRRDGWTQARAGIGRSTREQMLVERQRRRSGAPRPLAASAAGRVRFAVGKGVTGGRRQSRARVGRRARREKTDQ
jgi:hypothetical protein